MHILGLDPPTPPPILQFRNINSAIHCNAWATMRCNKDKNQFVWKYFAAAFFAVLRKYIESCTRLVYQELVGKKTSSNPFYKSG